MRIMLAALCTLVSAAAAATTASATTVTATVSDTDGQTWSLGTYTATLTLPGGVFTTAVPTVGGRPVPTVVSGFMDLHGVLLGSFTDTSTLDQRDLVWVFNVCPHTSAHNACHTIRTPITGAAEDLTPLFTHLPAPRFPATGYAYGYRDSEVERPIPEGGLYWNFPDRCLHQWDGIRWSGCGSVLQSETTPPPIAESTTIAGESVSSALNVSDQQFSAVAEATTIANDLWQAGTNNNVRTGSNLTANTTAHVIDYRLHSTLDYCRNENSTYCHNFTSLWDTPAFEPNGTIFPAPRHGNLNLVSTDVSPGVYETGVWNTTQGLLISHLSASEGISQGLSILHNQNGIGDGVGIYLYHNYTGCGSPMGDDEGCFAVSFASLENDSQTAASTGTIARVGENGQSIVFTNTTGLGQGRPAIRLRDSGGADQAVLSTTVTSIDGSTATSGIVDADHLRIGVQATLTPALAIGQCAEKPCTIEVPTNPVIPQKVTFPIRISGGSAAGFKAGPACITGGGHYEKIDITEVSGASGVGNTQSVTAMMWQRELDDLLGVAPILVQDPNYCGLFGTLDASIVTADPNYPIRQYFPILGALDAHTLLYAFPGRFRQQYLANQQVYDIWPQTAPVSITSNGTIATVALSGNTNWNGRQVTIAGTTSFNGTFLFSAQGSITSGQAYVYTFPIAGTAVSTPQTGTATTNTGRDGLRLYAGDLVASPYNPDQNDQLLEDYAGFFNSSTHWAPGDVVEFPPFWYTVAGMEYNHQVCYSDNCTGYVWQYAGEGVNNGFIGLSFGNTNPQEDYLGFGGHLGLPIGLSIGGPHDPIVDFTYIYNGGTPLVSGGTAIKFPCPRDNSGNNCQAPYNAWALFRAPTKSDNLAFLVNVPANSYDLDFTTTTSNFSFSAKDFTANGIPVYLDTDNSASWLDLGSSIRGPNSSGLHFKGTGGNDAWVQLYQWNTNPILTLGTVQDAALNHPTPIITDSSELHVSNFYADSSAHLVNLKVGYPETPAYGAIKATLEGATGAAGTVLSYLWVPVMPDGTAGSPGRTEDVVFVDVPPSGLSSTAYVQITCPAAVMPWHPAGTTYEAWGYSGPGAYWRVGACPIGGTVNDTRGNTAPSGPLPAGGNGRLSAGYANIAAAIEFSTRDANGFDVTDTYLKRTDVGVLSLGTTPGANDGVLNAAAIAGPEHAPTGKCITGQWSLSKDGAESFCQSSTWVSKSSRFSEPPGPSAPGPSAPTPASPPAVHTTASVSSPTVAPGSCTTWTSQPLTGLTSSMTIALSFASPIPPGWLTGQPAFTTGAVTINLCNLSGAPGAFPSTPANIAAQ